MSASSEIEKPTPPEAWECCAGGACQPCVWDSYYEALNTWRQSQLAKTQPTPSSDQGDRPPEA